MWLSATGVRMVFYRYCKNIVVLPWQRFVGTADIGLNSIFVLQICWVIHRKSNCACLTFLPLLFLCSKKHYFGRNSILYKITSIVWNLFSGCKQIITSICTELVPGCKQIVTPISMVKLENYQIVPTICQQLNWEANRLLLQSVSNWHLKSGRK